MTSIQPDKYVSTLLVLRASGLREDFLVALTTEQAQKYRTRLKRCIDSLDSFLELYMEEDV